MTFQKINEKFPIYYWKDFYVLSDSERLTLIDIVLENKKRNHVGYGGSFKIDQDPSFFFAKLYKNFFFETNKFFGGLKISSRNSTMCWSYSSNNIDHGAGIIHNHIKTSTVNSVYYLNVPDSVTVENGSIEFHLNGDIFKYRPNNFDLLIFPNYLDHKINFLDDPEYRISINMEIVCDDDPTDLFKI